MAVLVAEDHAVVLGVDGHAVERRKEIRHRSNRRDDAAHGVRRPFVGRDAAFLRETPGRLRDLHRGVVHAIGCEQRLERRVVRKIARGAGLGRRLSTGEQQGGRGRGSNQDATHMLFSSRALRRSARRSAPLRRAKRPPPLRRAKRPALLRRAKRPALLRRARLSAPFVARGFQPSGSVPRSHGGRKANGRTIFFFTSSRLRGCISVSSLQFAIIGSRRTGPSRRTCASHRSAGERRRRNPERRAGTDRRACRRGRCRRPSPAR